MAQMVARLALPLVFFTFSFAHALHFRLPLRRSKSSNVVSPRNYRRLEGPADDASVQRSWAGNQFLRNLPGSPAVLLDNTVIKKKAKDFNLLGRFRTRAQTKDDTAASRMGGVTSASDSSNSKKVISNVEQLRHEVLDKGTPLRNLQVDLASDSVATEELIHHEVVELIAERFKSQSRPGARHEGDEAILALSMEGGGMRGAVSAGMAAAIATLGLTDTFDKIYGSSAGSVIGAYMVSRQMCMDVYVDILPASKKSFVCLKRMISAIAATAVDWALSHVYDGFPKLGLTTMPGMNISFVLDGIMDDAHGIRPLDMPRFRANDAKQPLRVASSYVENGHLKSKCFGSEHFFSDQDQVVRRSDGRREGIYACLEASMTVPGATGAPVPIIENNKTLAFFDAFCFEPLPYRSAVEEGATHVLVLASRPEGFQPKTTQGAYERAIAPLYFRTHGEEEVATFFEKGGQQYIYAEDLLTLEEGKTAGLRGGTGVHVPPPEILHGVSRESDIQKLASKRRNWKKAQLLPLKVSSSVPELQALEQDRDKVSDAVRAGFASAFDLLAPAIDIELKYGLKGADVANLVFPPDAELDDLVLQNQLRIYGDAIASAPEQPTVSAEPPSRRRKRDIVRQLLRLRKERVQRINAKASAESFMSTPTAKQHKSSEVHSGRDDKKMLLASLPGFSGGNMAHLSTSLLQETTA